MPCDLVKTHNDFNDKLDNLTVGCFLVYSFSPLFRNRAVTERRKTSLFSRANLVSFGLKVEIQCSAAHLVFLDDCVRC